MLTWIVCLKKCTCVKIILENVTQKKTKHTPSGYSLFKNFSFDAAKNKLDYYRGKDCIKKFCKDLRKHTIRIVNYEKKEMIPLTDEENQFYEEKKVCSICKKLCSTDND